MKHADFVTYVALGDSISIDYYPAADVARRHPGKASSDQIGAASLFFRNDDRLWPEFRRRDLSSSYRGIDRIDLTADGATTVSLSHQVDQLTRSEDPTLVTITAGGNDLLGEIGMRGAPLSGAADNPADEIFGRLQRSVRRVLELRPQSVIIVGTVYDPSDGTNRLPGYPLPLKREAEWLRKYNDAIARLVSTDPRLRLADIRAHFIGHGVTVPESERWYLEESIIEPNARGASEVRRLWLEAIGR